MTAVLLTGIGGSIGCHTFRHIMQTTDWNVVGIDSFRHRGLTDRVEEMLRTHPEDRSRLRLFTHDLRAPISTFLSTEIGHVDFIINLASLSDVKDSIKNPSGFLLDNMKMILSILEFARVCRPRVFMQISTDEVYGPIAGGELGHGTEFVAKNGEAFHKEWDPILPSNPYSASKAAQEAACIAYWRTFDVPLILINMMNNFGEMQSPAKFPSIAQRKLSRGETVTVHVSEVGVGSRFYLHSRNASDAMIFLLKNCPPNMHITGEIDRPDRYNIAGDGRLSNLELVLLFARLMGVKPNYITQNPLSDRPGFDAHYGLNGDKLAALGWRPPLAFLDSVASMVQWHREHPEWIDPK
jgi:dTDP-glucose 4,6-dehydratase